MSHGSFLPVTECIDAYGACMVCYTASHLVDILVDLPASDAVDQRLCSDQRLVSAVSNQVWVAAAIALHLQVMGGVRECVPTTSCSHISYTHMCNQCCKPLMVRLHNVN